MRDLLWGIIAIVAYIGGFILGRFTGESKSAQEAIKPHHLQPLWWRSRIVWAETRQYEKAKNPNED